MDKRKKRLTLAAKDSIAGILFSTPFIAGFLIFFLSPVLLYIKMGFSKVSLEDAGMSLKGFDFENYRQVFFVQEGFLKQIFISLGELLLTFPAILFFSFFIALLLNQKFIGRTAARAIFFLPVIIASGVAAIGQFDTLTNTAVAAVSGVSDNVEDTVNLTYAFMDILGASVPPSFFNIIGTLVDKIYVIAMHSSVQILIFLAGLQTISPSLYEVSTIEGATGWEKFWKITLPMTSPIILVNAVYTVTDVLGKSDNAVVNDLYELSIQRFQFGISSAMGTVYFLLTFAILGLVIFAISRFVYYEDR